MTIPRVTTNYVTHYRFNIMAKRIYFITRPSMGSFSLLFFLNREGINTEIWYDKFLLPGNICTSFISFSLF